MKSIMIKYKNVNEGTAFENSFISFGRLYSKNVKTIGWYLNIILPNVKLKEITSYLNYEKKVLPCKKHILFKLFKNSWWGEV